jgi:type I restriction enzyme M protein
VELADIIIKEFETVTLLDRHDAYEVLLSYWNNTMADDVYILVEEGYKSAREIDVFLKTTVNKKTGKQSTKETGWEGKLIPKTLIIQMFFSMEQKLIDDTDLIVIAAQAELDEIIENSSANTELSEEDDEDDADFQSVEKEIKKRKKEIAEKNKLLKELKTALDNKVRAQYAKLTDKECFELLIERKWYCSITGGIYALYETVNHRITDRVTELNTRYEETLPELEKKVAELEGKVKGHLKVMGFTYQ